MEVQFPSANELSTMWGNNPIAIMQQQKQIDLANQFAQQGLQRNQEDLRAKQLANMFEEQNNPLKLQEQQARNEGLGLTNRGLGVNTRISEATEADQLTAKRKQLALDASDSDIKQMGNVAQHLAYSRNPQERAMGMELMKQHRDFVKFREESAIKQKNELSQIAAQGAQARLTQQQAIDAGKYKKGSGGLSLSIEDQLRSGKLNFEKAAVLLNNAAVAAQMEGDLERAQIYQGMANDYNNKHIESRRASAQVGQGGRPDMAQLGIATRSVPEPTQFTNPIQAPAAAPQAQTPKAPAGDVAVYQKAFGGYQPDKYEYRIGPGGVPQRRIKGSK